MGYDAFISYSHESDLDLARVTRDGLQKLAKPWNRRRALDIFLDQSSLELSSELGSSLDDRIEDTEWLVLFMSETSADSKWVGAEIAEWAEEKSKDKMALVLTSGEIVWNDEANDFDYGRSSAVNEGMRGIYTGQESEPLYLDMRWTKAVPEGEAGLGLDDVRFRDAIATISASIQGKSKDEVEGDDIRAHRRLVRIRRIAVTALVLLTAAAVVAGIFAWIQRNDAIQEANRANSRALASDSQNNVEIEPDLAALLALESMRIANTADARGSVARVLSRPTRFLQRTDAHENPVTVITFGASGALAATGDDHGVIRIWDVNESPLPPPQATVREGAFELASEVEQLVIVEDDGTVRLLGFDAEANLSSIDLETGDVSQLSSPDSFVSVAVSPVDSLLAGLTVDGYLRVYELADDDEFALRAELFADSDAFLDAGEVGGFAFSPDGAAIGASAGMELLVWEWASGSNWTRQLETEVTSVAFSPDAELDAAVVAVGEASGNIRLFDRGDPDLWSDPEPGLFNTVFDLAFKPAPDDLGNYSLASAHGNGEVILWSVIPSEGDAEPWAYEVEAMRGHRDETRAIAFSPDGRIASADFEGEIIFWLDEPASSLGTGRLIPGDDPPGLGDVAFVDGEHVAAGDENGISWVWDIGTPGAEPESVWDGLTALDAEVGVIAAGLGDGTVAVYDVDGDGTSLGISHADAIGAVALSEDAGTVAVASGAFPSAITVWDVVGDMEITAPSVSDNFGAESLLLRDGVLWVGGQTDEGDFPVVLKIDVATGEILGTIQHSDRAGNSVSALALTDDGRVLATGAGDRKIALWNARDLEPETDTEFSGHRGSITGIVFWDDGETMISSDEAGEIVMWDVSQQRLFGFLAGPTREVVALEIDPGSETLLAASGDATVWTWTLDPEDWRALACQLAARNMDDGEWELYGDEGTRVRHCPENVVDEGGYRDARYGTSLTD